MKKIIITLLLISFYSIAGAQWVTQHTSAQINFTAIDMVDNNTAYAVGSSSGARFAKTTDGGVNWVTGTINAAVIILYDVKFLNANTGYVAGQNGIMYKTTNGGTNWQLLTTGTSRAFKNIDFINENTGFGSGDLGMGRKTTNGGVSWDTIDVSANTSCTGLDFVDASTGFVTFFQSVYKTTDAGETWQPTLLSQLYDVKMLNAATGFATGYNSSGYVYRTTNGGSNWSMIATGLPPALEGTIFTSANIGYVYGFSTTSYIAKTTNGGVNWNRQVSSIVTRIGDLDFSSPDTAMAVGGNSIMFTSNAGGTTSISLISSEIPSGYKLSQNYPNPFNPVTKISFDIPNASFVRLQVFDMLGKEVVLLVNEKLKEGQYEYIFDGGDLKSGVYFYTLEADGIVQTKKMLLIK